MRFLAIAMMTILGSASNVFANECVYKEINIPTGIYSLQSLNPTSVDQFVQVTHVFSEDGGKLMIIAGLEFKDQAMTTAKLEKLTPDELYDSAKQKTQIYYGNAGISSRVDTFGNATICKDQKVGWETVNFEGYRSTGANVTLQFAQGGTAYYSLIIPGGTAVGFHSW